MGSKRKVKKLTFNKNYNKWFLSAIRNLIDKYKLIPTNEKIALGLSGGKDSTTLLYILAYLKKYSSLSFDLYAIHVKTADYDTAILQNICDMLSVPYIEAKINRITSPKNICYHCSKAKRKIIKETLFKHNIRTVAFAHNKDDVLETFLMNLVLHKRIETISPLSFSSDFRVIRPMLDIEKSLINRLFKYFDLPLLEYDCPHQQSNKRQLFRDWITNHQEDEIVIKMLENITQAFTR